MKHFATLLLVCKIILGEQMIEREPGHCFSSVCFRRQQCCSCLTAWEKPEWKLVTLPSYKFNSVAELEMLTLPLIDFHFVFQILWWL